MTLSLRHTTKTTPAVHPAAWRSHAGGTRTAARRSRAEKSRDARWLNVPLSQPSSTKSRSRRGSTCLCNAIPKYNCSAVRLSPDRKHEDVQNLQTHIAPYPGVLAHGANISRTVERTYFPSDSGSNSHEPSTTRYAVSAARHFGAEILSHNGRRTAEDAHAATMRILDSIMRV